MLCDFQGIVEARVVLVSPGVDKGGNMAGDLFPLTVVCPCMADLVVSMSLCMLHRGHISTGVHVDNSVYYKSSVLTA